MKARVMAVVSPKGGVGKTSVSVNLAVGLSQRGYKVCVVDLDLGFPNVEVALSVETQVTLRVSDILSGSKTLPQTLQRIPYCPNLHMLAGTYDANVASAKSLKRLLQQLTLAGYQMIIIDTASGMSPVMPAVIDQSDDLLLVIEPDMPCLTKVRHFHQLVGQQLKRHATSVNLMSLVNRYRPQLVADNAQISIDDIGKLVPWPLLGVIPEDDEEKLSNEFCKPVIFRTETSIAQAYWDTIDRYTGTNKPLRFIEVEQRPNGWRNWLGKLTA